MNGRYTTGVPAGRGWTLCKRLRRKSGAGSFHWHTGGDRRPAGRKLETMMTNRLTSALALAGVVAASISTAAFAERGNGPGHGADLLLDLFDEIDANKDGTVTQAEIDAFRAARFAAADANGDGGLDSEELATWRRSEMQARMAERAERLLAERDANGDGKLQIAELDRPRATFGRADTNEDGVLSREEAEAARDRMFERRSDRRGRRGGDN
jgi:hypothetical protein